MKSSEARRICTQHAREAAQADLKFSGNAAIDKLNISAAEKQELRAALIFYAEAGASRAVSLLYVHGVFGK